MSILKTIFINFPYTINLYIDLSSREKLINTGYMLQKENCISRYIDIAPYEGELAQMKTIIDYIKKVKDKTFIEEPYNDLDCLVFSLLSYAKLEGIIPNPILELVQVPLWL